MPIQVTPGCRFDTPYESGCIAETAPDADGGFLALDSDGVRCQFHSAMVVRIDGEHVRELEEWEVI